MFSRRILHHGPDPRGPALLLQDRAIAGCWFELLRQGGCGAGEVVLRDEFPARHAIDIGDWLSCEAAPGDRWYLGRVEERRAASPAEVRLRLEGMSVELGEVFPGGFGPAADGLPPHRFADTDLFPHDPDRSLETLDTASSADAVVRLLLARYVLPATHITVDPARIETPRYPAPLTSLKVRGEESVRALLKELALRAQAAWGVDPHGEFFFVQPRPETLVTWREGRDLVSLDETRDRELLFNRVLLTGDYVYDPRSHSDQHAQRSYRWRGNYTQPESCARYGDRRIRLWVPWIRTDADSLAFVREFFRTYAQPTSRFLIETTPQSTLPLPWHGRIRLEDRHGEPLTVATIESLRVLFDHAPRFRLELGPADPRDLWPEPPHDERWELPTGRSPGGPVGLTSLPPFPGQVSTVDASDRSSDLSSDESSDHSSSQSSSAPASSGWSSGTSRSTNHLSSADSSVFRSSLSSDASSHSAASLMSSSLPSVSIDSDSDMSERDSSSHEGPSSSPDGHTSASEFTSSGLSFGSAEFSTESSLPIAMSSSSLSDGSSSIPTSSDSETSVQSFSSEHENSNSSDSSNLSDSRGASDHSSGRSTRSDQSDTSLDTRTDGDGSGDRISSFGDPTGSIDDSATYPFSTVPPPSTDPAISSGVWSVGPSDPWPGLSMRWSSDLSSDDLVSDDISTNTA